MTLLDVNEQICAKKSGAMGISNDLQMHFCHLHRLFEKFFSHLFFSKTTRLENEKWTNLFLFPFYFQGNESQALKLNFFTFSKVVRIRHLKFPHSYKLPFTSNTSNYSPPQLQNQIFCSKKAMKFFFMEVFYKWTAHVQKPLLNEPQNYNMTLLDVDE